MDESVTRGPDARMLNRAGYTLFLMTSYTCTQSEELGADNVRPTLMNTLRHRRGTAPRGG